MWVKQWRDFHFYIMCGDAVIVCVDGINDYVVEHIIEEHNKSMKDIV